MSKKIKLFVDAHVFDGISQGTVSFIANLYSGIIKENNYEVYVGSNNKTKAIELLNSEKFIHVRYNTNSKYLRLLFEIPYHLWKNKIDFAHFQYITPIVKPCKFILTIHDVLFLDFPQYFPLIYRLKNKILFKISTYRANIFTTVSKYSSSAIKKHFNYNKNIFVIPNILNTSLKNSQIETLLNKKKYILYVSRIEPRKNHALLLKAWLELELYNQEIYLVFVGHNTIESKDLTNNFINMNELQKKYFIHFNNINSPKLSWMYSNCLLFVFPSLAEGFGIPPLEASLFGSKVLVSNSTAMKDFDFFPYNFNPSNYEEFKSKLELALQTDYNIQSTNEIINNTYNQKKITTDFLEIIENYK
jgi:glycosyltransferase involved in cell wall biosynthesis